MKTDITTTTITIKYTELQSMFEAISNEFIKKKLTCYEAATEGNRSLYIQELTGMKYLYNLIKIFGPIMWDDTPKTFEFWNNYFKKRIETANNLDLQCF